MGPANPQRLVAPRGASGVQAASRWQCSRVQASYARHSKAHPVAEVSASPARAVCSTERTAPECLDAKRQELERAYSHNEATPLHLAGPIVWEAPRMVLRPECVSDRSIGILQVQVGGGPEPPKQRHERHDDFYANVGDAIRTLREDVPVLFKRELNYDIYRDDVVFRDPRNCFRGMKNYKTIFWSLRFHGNLFFKDLYVEVKRIWQKTDDTICLRWTVHGFPRLPWDQEGTFDGVSTYKLDSHGKIYEHKVDNVIMGDPPVQRLRTLVTLNLSPARQPYPTPWQSADVASLPADAGQA